MSRYRISTLTLALTAALGFSAAASAATVTSTMFALPTWLANVDVKDNATLVTTPTNLTIDVNISPSDLIIGRTTGFSLRVDLQDGAQFGAQPAAPTIGSAATGWTATLAAGGQSGDTYAVYSIQPGSSSAGLTDGTLLAFPGFTLKQVGGLGTVGHSVAATFTFADPNTATQILAPVTQSLLTAVDPLKYNTIPSISNWAYEKINVAANPVSKASFAINGTLADSASYSFDAGGIQVDYKDNVFGADGSNFQWNGASLKLDVAGNFAALTQPGASVYLAYVVGLCSPSWAIANGNGTVNAAGTHVTFSESFTDSQISRLCFTLPDNNTQAIDATSIATTAVVTNPNTGKSSTASGNLLPMQYNGPVAKVFTFNPASNTAMQSFLRITNTGGSGGLVTISGTDDAGKASGTVSFTLGAGKSMQLTAQDLENGNAAKGLTGSLGAGTGKWRLTVTGQIAGMEVTNLNRSQSTNMVTNLGKPVSGDSGAPTFIPD